MKQSKLSFAKARPKSQSQQDGQSVTAPAGSISSDSENLPSQDGSSEHGPEEVVPEAVPTIEKILESYEEWKIKIPDNLATKHSRTQRNWLAKFNPDWVSLYPWIQTVEVNGHVVGILCSVCRSKCAVEDSLFQCVKEKSQGKFIQVPFV